MRKFFISSLLLCAATGMYGQNSLEIIISESGSTEIQALPRVGLGMSLAVDAPDPMDNANGLDLYVDILGFETEAFDNVDFVAGIGVERKAYRFKDDNLRYATMSDVIGFDYFPSGASPKYSSLRVYNCNFSAGFNFRFGDGISLAIIPELNLNIGCRIKNKYKLDGDMKKETIKKIDAVRPVTYDIKAMVTFSDTERWGVYVKYSPVDVLKEDHGPEFQSLSLGVCF